MTQIGESVENLYFWRGLLIGVFRVACYYRYSFGTAKGTRFYNRRRIFLTPEAANAAARKHVLVFEVDMSDDPILLVAPDGWVCAASEAAMDLGYRQDMGDRGGFFLWDSPDLVIVEKFPDLGVSLFRVAEDKKIEYPVLDD